MRAQSAIDNLLTETLIDVSRYTLLEIDHHSLYLDDKDTNDLQ
jgi:hypothetical protein